MTKPIVVVIGATGGQGGSVVSSFLSDGKYAVRGITRNTHSEKAKALHAKGVEVVSADLNNQSSLVEAFKVLRLGLSQTPPYFPTLTLLMCVHNICRHRLLRALRALRPRRGHKSRSSSRHQSRQGSLPHPNPQPLHLVHAS
jgi:NAD(P)-dependent dehydrogenase (short-subunit alcohol dehydrogenase family)